MKLENIHFRYDAAAQHLYCTLPLFRHSVTLRVRSWSEGCRVDVEGICRWDAIATAVDLSVASGLPDTCNDHPMALYAHELPQDVARGVAAFASGQLAMLRVCAASPRGEQLLRGAPMLLWLAAPTLLRESGAEPERLHSLLGLRQRELLVLCCGCGDKALLRMLAKVPPSGTTQAARRIVTAILTREEINSLLRHKKALDWQVLARIAGLRNIPPAMRDLIGRDMEASATVRAIDELESMTRDATRLGLELGIEDAAAHVAACTRFTALQNLHDAWTERLNRTKQEDMVRKYGEHLPPPPLAGVDGIQPIDSVRELFMEGAHMHHCVGGYAHAVLSGRCYIYRVTKPERATLEIRRDEPGPWELGQLKSYCNQRPGEDTARLVRQWFSDRTTR